MAFYAKYPIWNLYNRHSVWNEWQLKNDHLTSKSFIFCFAQSICIPSRSRQPILTRNDSARSVILVHIPSFSLVLLHASSRCWLLLLFHLMGKSTPLRSILVINKYAFYLAHTEHNFSTRNLNPHKHFYYRACVLLLVVFCLLCVLCSYSAHPFEMAENI